MDRTELKNILRDESSSSLRSLHPDFYRGVGKYVRELEEEIRAINNSRSVESKMLEDELQSAITDVEVIFIRRIKKIITRATNNAFSSKSYSQDISKLLPEEKKVYDAVLSAINTSRDELVGPMMYSSNLDTKNDLEMKEVVPEEVDISSLPPSGTVSGVVPDIMNNEKGYKVSAEKEPVNRGEDNNKSEIGKSNINKEFVVVRILENLPTFKATDNRNYTLYTEDVVVLPALNAKGLVKRKVAQMIM